MDTCRHCGLSDGRHFDGCPSGQPGRTVTRNDDPPICGPKRLGDTLDRAYLALAERSRED